MPRRADRARRGHARRRARRGLRALRGHLRLDAQPATTASASPARSACRCPARRSRVVDRDGRPVPQGERGEVVIRGANVMRGYLNRPEDDREDARRRLAAHRRRRHLRRRRLPADRRPHQGHDHPRRREHLPQGDRDGALHATTACSRPRSSGRPDECSARSSSPTSPCARTPRSTAEQLHAAVRRAPGEVQAPRGHRAASTRCRRTRSARSTSPRSGRKL